MSVACFPCSLPAGPYGYPDGRGTPDIFRRTAKPPAPTRRLIRWNKYHGSVVPANSSPSPSPAPSQIPVDGEKIVFNLKEWLSVYQRVERCRGTSSPADDNYVEASLDPVTVQRTDGSSTSVKSTDIVILPDVGVSARVYLPEVAESSGKKVPIIVYYHGGGFIIESTGSKHYHNFTTRLAANAGVLIVSVNYRLAPEYPIPAAYDDSMAALNWVVSHSKPGTERLGSWLNDYGDFSKLFVAGDSAGGNITHYVAMRANDAGLNIEGIALLHPYFFGKRPVGEEEDDTVNMLFHSKLWPLIAPESEGLDDPRVNPFGPRSPSLNGIKCKKAVVVVAGEDFHRFRGRMYYEALAKCMGKGNAGLLEQEGVGHDYFLDHFDTPEWVELVTQMVNFLKGEEVRLGRIGELGRSGKQGRLLSGPVTFTTN